MPESATIRPEKERETARDLRRAQREAGREKEKSVSSDGIVRTPSGYLFPRGAKPRGVTERHPSLRRAPGLSETAKKEAPGEFEKARALAAAKRAAAKLKEGKIKGAIGEVVKGVEVMASQMATRRLLDTAWGALVTTSPTVFGALVSLAYINIHFIASYFSERFCKMKIYEIVGVLAIDLLMSLIIFIVIVFIFLIAYAIFKPWNFFLDLSLGSLKAIYDLFH